MINKKHLLSEIRQGDYAHAGGEEAIKLIMPFLEEKRRVLDAGCGLGGTANYIQTSKKCDVIGIDIDHQALKYGKSKYENVKFDLINIHKASIAFPPNAFDAILFFNSFYSFKNQPKALHEASAILEQNGIIIIFDYASNGEFTKSNPFPCTEDKVFAPINLETIQNNIGNNYDVIIKNITELFIIWYKETILRLKKDNTKLVTKFGATPYNLIYKSLTNLIDLLYQKQLLGVLIIATKRQ